MSPMSSGNWESKTAGTSLSVLWSIDGQGYLGSTARSYQLENASKLFVVFLAKPLRVGVGGIELMSRGSQACQVPSSTTFSISGTWNS
jgi:hypothetical protein